MSDRQHLTLMGLQDLNSVRAVCVWFGLAYSIFLMGGGLLWNNFEFHKIVTDDLNIVAINNLTAYMGYRKGSTVSLVMGGLSAAGAMVGFALYGGVFDSAY
jgi:hypothetical protein